MKKLGLLCTLLATLGITSAATAAAVDYTDADQCSGCAMWINKWPGPKGQLEMKDGTVKKYCCVKCMLCNYLGMEDKSGIAFVWVQDTNKVDWEHPHGDHIDALPAWFVQGSSKVATMGKSVAPFKTKAEAEAFQKEFGGQIYRLEDFDRTILGCKKKKM